MAWDNNDAYITLPATTGLVQYTFVAVNASGQIAKPALGARVVGVLVSSGTNGSTEERVGTVQLAGVSKVLAVGSTNLKGQTVGGSSGSFLGYAKKSTGSVGGIVVDGSSGATGRILSVLLTK